MALLCIPKCVISYGLMTIMNCKVPNENIMIHLIFPVFHFPLIPLYLHKLCRHYSSVPYYLYIYAKAVYITWLPPQACNSSSRRRRGTASCATSSLETCTAPPRISSPLCIPRTIPWVLTYREMSDWQKCTEIESWLAQPLPLVVSS